MSASSHKLVAGRQPSLYPVDLQINPPYTWHADDTPERGLLADCPDGKPLQEEEVGQGESQQ